MKKKKNRKVGQYQKCLSLFVHACGFRDTKSNIMKNRDMRAKKGDTVVKTINISFYMITLYTY